LSSPGNQSISRQSLFDSIQAVFFAGKEDKH
jgi:hypothetical protein